jgi:hypothetical protein
MLIILIIVVGILFFGWLGFLFWVARRQSKAFHLDEREKILARYDKDLMLATDPEERSRLFMKKEAELELLNRP